MPNINVDEMTSYFIHKMIEYFGNRVDGFCVSDVIDDPNHRAFSITLKAYNYYCLRISYDKGYFGCCILAGEDYALGLDNSQKWWYKADFDAFFKELKTELELRIPDKYLKEKGWK